mgnify:CR=1 FL=1
MASLLSISISSMSIASSADLPSFVMIFLMASIAAVIRPSSSPAERPSSSPAARPSSSPAVRLLHGESP